MVHKFFSVFEGLREYALQGEGLSTTTPQRQTKCVLCFLKERFNKTGPCDIARSREVYGCDVNTKAAEFIEPHRF
jgi:hypothetical protein